MSLVYTISLLPLYFVIYMELLVVSTTAEGNHDIQIIQRWRQNNASTYLPLNEVRELCKDTDILSLRLEQQFYGEAMLIHAGVCSEGNKRIYQDRLYQEIVDCYKDSSCQGVDLQHIYYSSLIKADCTLCTSKSCNEVSTDVLSEKGYVEFEVGCVVNSKTFSSYRHIQLNSSSDQNWIPRNQLVSSCQKAQTTNVYINDACPRYLEDDTQDRSYAIREQIKGCINAPECEGVKIVNLTACSQSGEVGLVIFHSKDSSDVMPPIPVSSKPCSQPDDDSVLIAFLVILTILLLLSAAVNVYLLVFKSKYQRDQTLRINNNQPVKATPLSDHMTTKKTTTLGKYERSVEHSLDDHRYSSLRAQNSEDRYEYVDTETQGKNKTDVDSSGYLIPESAPRLPQRSRQKVKICNPVDSS